MHLLTAARRLLLVSLAATSLVACAKLDIVHELEERDANEIIVLLDAANPPIAAAKLVDGEGGGGNKGPRFKINVAAGDANRAWKLLTENNLPRRKDLGLSEVFAAGGLVPTASEEKAKMLSAIQGEIARTLKSIDGVLDARVHVVMPEDSVLRVHEDDKVATTASVWYKYAPRGKNSPKPLTDQEVAQLVANSVEKLKHENVKVIATPALGMTPPPEEAAAGAGVAAGAMERLVGITVLKSDVNKLKGMLVGAVTLVVVLTFIFMVALVKKSNNAVAPKGLSRPNPPAEPPAAA